ncbi:MAG: hypothetical protein K2Y27_33870 [Xanthobacteraceae bacterium]|nr:hypothetical protein [Xanthobacteraceae bacterium]
MGGFGHPARAIARRHKALVEEWLAEAFAAVRVRMARACDVMLLVEGTMALMLIHGDPACATAAAQAAKKLVARG